MVTDINKDGMLSGPNLDLLRHVCARTTRPVIASGGVSSLADLKALAALMARETKPERPGVPSTGQ